MRQVPTVARLMTPFPYAVQESDSLADADRLMAEHAIRHVPVTRGRTVIGMLSLRELTAVAAVADATVIRVGEVFTRSPYVVEHDTTAEEVAATMAERHLGSAIVTRHGELAGIVTTTDVCRDYAEILRERRAAPPPDDCA